MTHGDQRPVESTSTAETVGETGTRGKTTKPTETNNNSSTKEERERTLERVEREMEIYRKGQYSRFQASTRVADELGKWAGASDEERGKAYDSYLAEINSHVAVRDEE